MGKPHDAAKERYWRNVLRRQAASGLGTGRFCEREQIAIHQFYWWRRTLQERDRRRAGPGQRGGARRRIREQPRRRRATASAFVPLPLPVSIGAPIEVVHPRGHVVRIPSLFDVDVLRRILATLDAPVASAGEA